MLVSFIQVLQLGLITHTPNPISERLMHFYRKKYLGKFLDYWIASKDTITIIILRKWTKYFQYTCPILWVCITGRRYFRVMIIRKSHIITQKSWALESKGVSLCIMLEKKLKAMSFLFFLNPFSMLNLKKKLINFSSISTNAVIFPNHTLRSLELLD